MSLAITHSGLREEKQNSDEDHSDLILVGTDQQGINGYRTSNHLLPR